ncbi:MAG TPA: class D sortase [Bryobacteraceae bacterium]|jgi:LPXTG-site transpeptidase (sortase) family protein
MTRSTTTGRSKARRWIEWILLAAGVAGLGVWAGQQVVSAVWQAWENRVFDLNVAEHEVPEHEIPEQSPAFVPRPPAAEGAPAQEETHAIEGMPAKETTDGTIIGRLSIPRLQLSAMVREGVDETTLSLALGHVPNTALPGQQGNMAVAGHRDTLFRSLRGIKKDDLIRIETVSSGSYLYSVRATEIVDPAEVSVLKPSQDSELTLVTCYPFNYIGPAPQRFIVKAQEVGRGLSGVKADVKGQPISFR